MSKPVDPIGKEPVPTEIPRTPPDTSAETDRKNPVGSNSGLAQFTVRQSVSAADRAAQLELRYRVLREPLGMSREQAVFARDDDADTVHLLAVAFDVGDTQGEALGDAHDEAFSAISFTGTASGTVTGQVVGTASMITHGPNDVQLRGMATDSAWSGRGVGKAVLEAAHKLAGSRSLWCDARMSAHNFYARLGWVAEGEIFDIPQVGPHTVMRFRGLPDSTS